MICRALRRVGCGLARKQRQTELGHLVVVLVVVVVVVVVGSSSSSSR